MPPATSCIQLSDAQHFLPSNTLPSSGFVNSRCRGGKKRQLWSAAAEAKSITDASSTFDLTAAVTQAWQHETSRVTDWQTPLKSISISYLTKSKTVISCLCLCLTQVLKWSNPVQSSTGLSHSKSPGIQFTSYKLQVYKYELQLRITIK